MKTEREKQLEQVLSELVKSLHQEEHWIDVYKEIKKGQSHGH